jgi:hypothetical protein
MPPTFNGPAAKAHSEYHGTGRRAYHIVDEIDERGIS